MMMRRYNGLLHVRRVPRSPSERFVSLLIGLRENLKSIQFFIAITHELANFVDVRRQSVAGTVDHRRGSALIRAQSDSGRAILAVGFDCNNIESKLILGLECTTNMELSIASRMIAWNTSTLGRLAYLARLSPSVLGDRTKAFRRL